MYVTGYTTEALISYTVTILPNEEVGGLAQTERSSKITFNFLPNDKILDWSKLKAFADDNVNLTQKWKFHLGRVENIVGKGENAGYQHFSFSYNVFKIQL